MLSTVRGKSIAQGASAGALAAIVMGLVLMIVMAYRGAGFFTFLQLIGATLLGGDWMSSPIAAASIGGVLHLLTGASLGAMFAFLVRDVDEASSALAAGVAYGASVFLFMTFLILPWGNPVMFYSIDKGLYFLGHLVFGLTLPIALLRRRVTVERPTMHPRHRHA